MQKDRVTPVFFRIDARYKAYFLTMIFSTQPSPL